MTTNWIRVRYRHIPDHKLPGDRRARRLAVKRMTEAEQDALHEEKDLFLMFPDLRTMEDAAILDNIRRHHLPAGGTIIRRGQTTVHRDVWPPREEIEAYLADVDVKLRLLEDQRKKATRIHTILSNNLAEYDQIKDLKEIDHD